ncbi:MAG TPA: ribokinase [Fimbriimonadaceae bacterium]|nr:ribokinase [Fimbriimonadaceae bacterium]
MLSGVPGLIVVGSANIDLVTTVPRFPVPGETVLGSGFARFTGGKGANQACAIAKLGGTPVFIGKVGNDSFGLQIISSLRQFGVDTSNVYAEQDISTGTAMITVAESGENTIVISPGANARVTIDFVEDRMGKQECRTVLTQLEIPVETVAAVLKEAEIGILDPAPATNLPKEIYDGLAWITPNESETESLTGIAPIDDATCEQAAKWFLDAGVQNVAVTLGAKGCYYANHTGGQHCRTISVSSVDSTAAGDAFSGALALFLNEGREPVNAVMIANRSGALATTRLGAQASLPSLAELQRVCSDIF